MGKKRGENMKAERIADNMVVMHLCIGRQKIQINIYDLYI